MVYFLYREIFLLIYKYLLVFLEFILTSDTIYVSLIARYFFNMSDGHIIFVQSKYFYITIVGVTSHKLYVNTVYRTSQIKFICPRIRAAYSNKKSYIFY